jgi:hypothetical protein
MKMMRASHAFVCVDVFVDGKRAGGHGTYMRAEVDTTTCKELLVEFLQRHTLECFPLPASTTVVLMCENMSDTVIARHVYDFGSSKDCSIFVDYHVTMAMAEVPTKRFIYKCSRPIEAHQRPRQDLIVVMMAQRATGNIHLPHV